MSDTKDVLASGEVIRERVVRIIRGMGHSLKEVEFYVYGTSTKEVGGESEDLRHDGVRNLFMAVDLDIASAFGSRKAAALGGRVCGILLVLDKATDRWLEEMGLLRAKQIDDMEGKIEYVFAPAAAPEINRRGVWVYLPPDIFEQEEGS